MSVKDEQQHRDAWLEAYTWLQDDGITLNYSKPRRRPEGLPVHTLEQDARSGFDEDGVEQVITLAFDRLGGAVWENLAVALQQVADLCVDWGNEAERVVGLPSGEYIYVRGEINERRLRVKMSGPMELSLVIARNSSDREVVDASERVAIYTCRERNMARVAIKGMRLAQEAWPNLSKESADER